MRSEPCRVAAIVPAYNEGRRVRDVVKEALQYVDEVLVVDDASEDDTADRAREAGARVVSQHQNAGYIAAIKRGFQEAQADIVVTIDADGEFPPEYIPQLVSPIRSGRADMVQGRRPSVARPSERFLTWLAKWKGPVGDSGTGFRALRTDLAKQLDLAGACICGVFSLEVLARGRRIVEVPVELKEIEKPRRVAWYHLRQLFYIIPWLWADVDSKT